MVSKIRKMVAKMQKLQNYPQKLKWYFVYKTVVHTHLHGKVTYEAWNGIQPIGTYTNFNCLTSLFAN